MFGHVIIVLLVAACVKPSYSGASGVLERARSDVTTAIFELVDTLLFEASPDLLVRLSKLTDEERTEYVANSLQLSTHDETGLLIHRNGGRWDGDLERRRLEMDHQLKMLSIWSEVRLAELHNERLKIQGDNDAALRSDQLRAEELRLKGVRLQLYNDVLKVVVIGGVTTAVLLGGAPLVAAVGANSAGIAKVLGAVSKLGVSVV